MGPRSEGARKGRVLLHLRRAHVASMGPRSEGARKGASPRARPRSCKSFNGAALGGSAERRLCDPRVRDRRLASMGPRSEGARKANGVEADLLSIDLLQWGRARRERGKKATGQSTQTTETTLQWGRARRERGKLGPLEFRQPMGTRFNGAALGGSAERLQGGAWAEPEALLQWGRARRERGKERLRRRRTAPRRLQWGRARRERGKHGDALARVRAVRASMGPRSEGARKAGPRRRGTSQLCRASMGPRSEGARKGRDPRLSRRARHRFNGAALGGSAERDRDEPADLPGLPRFNGAALGGSAERAEVPLGGVEEVQASMGPRSEGARKVRARD